MKCLCRKRKMAKETPKKLEDATTEELALELNETWKVLFQAKEKIDIINQIIKQKGTE